MQINLDPRTQAAGEPQGASVPIAREGGFAGKVAGAAMDSVVQADLGNKKTQTTTGTYGRDMTEGMEIKEISSDLDVMDPANFISQCMTGEDAHDLSEEKTPLEEYEASSLQRAIVRVGEQRAARADMVEASADKLRETEQKLRENAEDIAADSRLMAEMTRALAQADIPIKEDTASDIKGALDMVGGIDSIDDKALKYMIANETRITPKSVQDALFGSGSVMMGTAGIEAETASDIAIPYEGAGDGFEEILPQLKNRMSAEGYELSDTAADDAHWLYQQELPLTRENIVEIDTIRELRDMDSETLLNRIVSEMGDGVLASDADLAHMSLSEVGELVKKLVNTEEKELRRSYPTEADLISARRQLEEIRLTMTVNSAREMTKLGVSIDIENLEEMVEKLRELENDQRSSLLAETSLTSRAGAESVFFGTMDAADEVLTSPVELLSYTFESRESITFSELSARGGELKAAYVDGGGAQGERAGRAGVQPDIFKNMERTYEAVGTQVRTDLGDSIKKAFRNTDAILDDLGLETTPENERAVRILGYNRLDVTRESVLQMRTYDNRVNTLMSAMKPQVVKRMIEEDINPLELSLDELEVNVARIYREVDTEDIAFSKFLWKLDKQNAISEEERESMIGIYRLFDKIEKSDGAVVGQLVNEGRDLSLKNLLEAVRTRNKGGIDATVSDESGYVERGEVTATSIDGQILSAFIASEVPALKNILSPNILHRYTDSIDDMTPEELIDLVESESGVDEDMSVYYEEMAERIRSVMEDRETGAEIFFREGVMPETVRNMISANDFLRRQMKDVRDLWSEEEADEVVENFDDTDGIDEIYDRIEKSHLDSLEKTKESDDISFDGIQQAARMAGHIAFYKAIRHYQMYEVPVMTERGIVDCQVTIREGEKNERGTVEINVDSDELGRLSATFRLKGNRVNGFVTAENSDSISAYTDMLKNLKTDLEESGFTMDGNSLIAGNRNSLHIGDEDTGAKTQDLYRIAKCFLRSIG